MEKAAEAFRTISEVAELLDTPAHVLRFWESRFSQVKPVKRAGGRRYYRPTDLALLGGIKKLLHEDGLTIRGVQKILREQGVRHVADLCEVSLEPTDTARRKRATPGAAKRSAGTAARAAAPGTVPPATAQPASAQPATATPASAAPSTAAPSTAAPSTAAPAAAPASDAGPWPMSPSPDAAATGDALRPDPEDRPDAEDGPDPEDRPDSEGRPDAAPGTAEAAPVKSAPAEVAYEEEDEAPIEIDAPTLPLGEENVLPLAATSRTTPRETEPAPAREAPLGARKPAPGAEPKYIHRSDSPPAATLLRAMDALRAHEKRAELGSVYHRLSDLKTRMDRASDQDRH